jgi:hypothetical protein
MPEPALRDNPLFTALEGCGSIVVAGVGGGFDIYGGLPIALALHTAGKTVHLANLSFAPLAVLPLEAWLDVNVAVIEPDSAGPEEYFPERALSRWLEANGYPSKVYAFPVDIGVKSLRAAYRTVLRHVGGVDAIVLIDGGTDLLCRGDEAGLGTPEEDMTSLAAVAGLVEVPVKLAAAIGFGIDAFHGVNHTQILENLADLDADGAFLGAFSIPRASAEAVAYREVVAVANAATSRPSIVHGQIAAALDGRHGDVHATGRTRGSELFVNPLMAMYFTVTVDGLAKRHLYLDRIEGTQTMRQVALAIEEFRYDLTPRPRRTFPH